METKRYIFRKKSWGFLAAFLDALGYRAAASLRFRRKTPGPFNPRRALVIRMDHLGDVLLATAVPGILKENLPECRVCFLTSGWSAPLLRHNPFIDEVILYDAPWFSRGRYRRSAESLGFWRLVRRLRAGRIDLGIGFRGDARENILLALAGVKERAGYGITGGGFLLTREIRYRENAHESEHVLDLVRALGLRAEALRPRLYFSEEERESLGKQLEVWGILPEKKYVGFQVGAGTDSKKWPARNTRSFLRLFKERFEGYNLVLIGSSRTESEKITDFAGERFLNLVGKTTLRETCLLAERFSAFVGPDSGPTHIASAMGTPTVFLYSGTNRFEQWRPLSERAVAVRHEVPCSPCGLEVCNVPGHPCMSRIAPEEIIEALGRCLKN
ncbi:MAG: glycosyltransferase family 9 protein [Candidatus Omnitrophica bacterium]|nr:glycosyltransferase family 9 protein [Candidatus Omnitrophota bacterium]